MDRAEFERVQQIESRTPTLSVAAIGGQPRTLAYGYTVERYTWHCYLDTIVGPTAALVGRDLHVVVYDGGDRLVSYDHGLVLPLEALRPSKRAYPECCDATFATLMAAAGYALPFTTWDDARAAGRPTDGWFGPRADDLVR